MAETGLAAPITFNTALPVSQDHWVGREQVVYGETQRTAGRKMQGLSAITALGYGVTPDLAVFGVMPLVHRDLDTAMGASGASRDAGGFGDLRVFARYTAYHHDVSGRTFRVAPFLGVELPTGKNRKSDSLGQLPRGLQPGSGSWDVFGGVVASWASLDLNIDGQVAWQVNTRADGVNGGDVFQADLAVYRRLHPLELTADTSSFLFGGVEVNFRDEGRTRITGIADPNSGGQRLSITPGLQYARKHWMFEAAVQIPVTQSPHGTNFKQDYVFRVGFRLNL